MFPPRHEALLLWLLSIIYRDVIIGRHADDLGIWRGRRIRNLLVIVAAAVSHRFPPHQHLGDALFGRLEEAQHSRAAGGLGIAGQRAKA
jgi:hypothetical protein